MQIPEVGFTPTIPAFVRYLAGQWGSRDFVVTAEASLSYADAEETTRRIAKDLVARGHGKGSRIGFVFGNSAEWVLTWLAVARIGALALPFPTTYRPAELRKSLLAGDVDTLVVPTELFGRDQLDFVEDAVPGLSDVAGLVLRLRAIPCLRSCSPAFPAPRP